MMTRMLAACGHEVMAETDGAEALRRLKNDETIDVVMTSLEVPNLSGFELCWHARLLTHQRRPLYVIAMSSSYDDKKLVEALDSGADDFVRKPPQPAELSARLRAADRMVAAQRDLIRLATIDQLTGLKNRRAFFEEADTALAETAAPRAFAVVLFDIDHFKRINDSFGHDAGDAVLTEMGERIRACAGMGARLGGEEFALLLRDHDLAGAAALAERLRLAIEAEPFVTPSGPVPVTSSFGVAMVDDLRQLAAAMKMADVALYAAKTAGRNRVITSSRDPLTQGSHRLGAAA
ncbi:MAG: diguanylate cyclase [Hyphomicrobiaceae bacterium]|nr:diguanylate cyclase [Hyphomicrobiaceae bacterium]